MARDKINTRLDLSGDWLAIRDDDEGEETARIGYGPTPEAAIAELKAMEADAADAKEALAQMRDDERKAARARAYDDNGPWSGGFADNH